MRKRFTQRRNYKRDKVDDICCKLNNKLHEFEPEICKFITNDELICHDIPMFAIDKSNNIINLQYDNIPLIEEFRISWDDIPNGLDPAAGKLDNDRAIRKRYQVQSLIYYIEIELEYLRSTSNNQKFTVVDYGAGSGHLGLLVAYRNQIDVNVILVERKEYTANIARDRISSIGLQNAIVFSEDVRTMNDKIQDLHISLGIGLHCCGMLTDIAIDMCISQMASFVISPCCYGQIGLPPPNFNQLLPEGDLDSKFQGSEVLFQNNRSTILFNNSIEMQSENLQLVSSFADFKVPKEINTFDYSQDIGFKLSKKCMKLIDFDRLLRVCQIFPITSITCQDPKEVPVVYHCSISSLFPLLCSPKNNIILGRSIHIRIQHNI